jgi:CDGSH-type Zn-finger protein
MADVTITPRDNGPYLVRGPVKLVDAEGNEFAVEGEAFLLCRCGNSSHKPFCDATHRKVDFQAVNRAKT